MREKERERERKKGSEKERESMRMGKESKVPEKQMFQNCIPTTNVNSL